MKVVDDKTKGWKLGVTCKDCQSVFEITADDVIIGEFGGVGWAGERGKDKPYVKCPICSEDNLLKVPAWVERQALANRSKRER